MNIGVSAVIRVVDSILEFLYKIKNLCYEILDGEQLANRVLPYLDSIIKFVNNLDLEGIKKLRGLFGSGATEKVLKEFQKAIHDDYPDYNPVGLEQWIKDSTGEFNYPAHEIGNNFIEPLIDKFIKSKLKEEFGEENNIWWVEGIPMEIKKKCSNNQIESKTMEPIENFLNTIHYVTIIEANWTLLGNYFTKPGMEKVKKDKKLEWLKKFNGIRQKYSHPQRENTTEDEYNFLIEIKEWLEKTLQ